VAGELAHYKGPPDRPEPIPAVRLTLVLYATGVRYEPPTVLSDAA
jgi:hypothetical protein